MEYSSGAWPALKKRLAREAFPPDKIEVVRSIIGEVKKDGDRALRKFTLKFDGVRITSFAVNRPEIQAARKYLSPELRRTFRRLERNLRFYFSNTIDTSWRKKRGDGLVVGEQVTPIERLGIYIPGGLAPLASTVFMTAVPARLAGIPRIILVSPPQSSGTINRWILAAADYFNINEIYKIGGAQAIAALAFGTKSIPKVDKIVGPGNIYVTLAKKEVFGFVDIDLLAGSSEVVILADGKASPRFIASDLLAQAEHGPGGIAILITTSRNLISAVGQQVEKLFPQLSRRAILRKSLEKGTFLIKVKSWKEGVELANRIAPEHLEIMLPNPGKVLGQIKNAGAIFLGEFSPVAAGDYVAGPSHILPTGRSARAFSGLSVSDFLKRSHVVRYNRSSLKRDLPALETLAKMEGLDAHRLSAAIRFEKKSNRIIRRPAH